MKNTWTHQKPEINIIILLSKQPSSCLLITSHCLPHIGSTMKRCLFYFARTGLGGWLLHWVFAYCSFLIPGEKLIETDSLVAFHHPQPAYPLHILIVPKARYNSLQDLPSKDHKFELELFQAVNELVDTCNLIPSGYRLIVNGGNSQEDPHLHFHLISEERLKKE